MLKVAMLLLFGAIINVAVAWCASTLYAMPATGSGHLVSPWQNDLNWICGRELKEGEFPLYQRKFTLEERSRLGVVYRILSESPIQGPMVIDPQPTRVVGYESLAGWPVHSLWGGVINGRTFEDRRNDFRLEDFEIAIFDLPTFAQREHIWSFETGDDGPRRIINRLFPLKPLWPGFAIDTFFYAAIVWLIFFARGDIRRAIRKRRHQCLACGYPIGVSPVCTECGAAVGPPALRIRTDGHAVAPFDASRPTRGGGL